jgi:hypothetical protein
MTATPEQIEEATRINEESRLSALKMGLLIMSGLALLAIVPAGRLPTLIPGDVPSDQLPETNAAKTNKFKAEGRQVRLPK